MTVLNSVTQQHRTLNRDTGATQQYHTWDRSVIPAHERAATQTN